MPRGEEQHVCPTSHIVLPFVSTPTLLACVHVASYCAEAARLMSIHSPRSTMEEFVRELLLECSSCKVFVGNVDARVSTEFITSLHPGDKMILDLKRMWESLGFLFFIVLVDHFSGFLWALALASKGAQETVAACALVDKFIETAKHPVVFMNGSSEPLTEGWPINSVQTDRGSEFVNKGMTAWMAEKNIKQGVSRPYHPQTQGVRLKLRAAREFLPPMFTYPCHTPRPFCRPRRTE